MAATAGAADPELPALPEEIDPERLHGLSEAELDAAAAALQAAARATTAAMAPYERHLGEARSRLAQIATERRRRERAAQVAQRAGVREGAKSGQMPTLAAALAGDATIDGDTPLTAVHAFLGTGGEIGFGFATRPGTIAFSDGRQQAQARTWGEARELHARGWDPGTPGIPGVRIHLAGTRVERVVGPEDVVVRVD
ncbi:MAG: hypothetical protein E6J45_06765 [Chloroflexi bacterium]|nr:MAG: hypothetical protein E6J45_06765 [Chloroflexota bacterium]